mmetsp:Transcript_165982/g.532835  ORF Transcript_165982/g.532835 Transcript_165982/m.532835 type:complete len:131 (+) Transcript_165982:345-737(+)
MSRVLLTPHSCCFPAWIDDLVQPDQQAWNIVAKSWLPGPCTRRLRKSGHSPTRCAGRNHSPWTIMFDHARRKATTIRSSVAIARGDRRHGDGQPDDDRRGSDRGNWTVHSGRFVVARRAGAPIATSATPS